MTASLYLESSFISYLVSRPSRDLLVAAHQQATQEWWEMRRSSFSLHVSQLVLDEITRGDKALAAQRLSIVEALPVLEINNESLAITEKIVNKNILAAKSIDDATHIAIAIVHSMEFLLTWNCKHIANAEIQKRIAEVAYEGGYEFPTICTPLELMGD